MAEERIIRSQSSVTLTISGALVSVRSLMEATKLFGPNPEGESYLFFLLLPLCWPLWKRWKHGLLLLFFFFPLRQLHKKRKTFLNLFKKRRDFLSTLAHLIISRCVSVCFKQKETLGEENDLLVRLSGIICVFIIGPEDGLFFFEMYFSLSFFLFFVGFISG